jgi:hypothetical protein
MTGREKNFDVLCECGDDGCDEVLQVSYRTYGAIRKQPQRLIIAPGHEAFVSGLVARRTRRHVVMERTAALSAG